MTRKSALRIASNRKSIVAAQVGNYKREGARRLKRDLIYLAIGALSFMVVTVLERLAAGLHGEMLRTEIYSIHGFSHIFFGIGLTSIILFLRPRSPTRLVLLAVLLAGIAQELREGLWLAGEPLDSLEDLVLAVLSALSFLCFIRKRDSEPSA